jgi:prefoldin subunit 1
VLESKETLVKGLEEASAAATTDIENAMARREYLMKQLSEAEMNLRELMQGNEALAKELQERGVV